MGSRREKVKAVGPDEYKIARDYIFRYIHGGRSEYKLASAIIHKGKMYEAFWTLPRLVDTVKRLALSQTH
jgi:hypothetical protein